MGWTLGLGVSLGFAIGGSSCNAQSDLPCQNDEQCLERGEGGQCEFNNFCSFPDEMCETGRRWDGRAPDSIAGKCYEPGTGGTATDTDASGTDTDDSGTDTADTTADPTTGPDPSTTTTTGEPDPSTTTGEPGTSTTSGAAMTCGEQYGAAMDYMLCVEEPDSCAFNVTVGMAASCNDVCTMYGGECIEAQLNETDLCVSTGAGTCDQMDFDDVICVCSR